MPHSQTRTPRAWSLVELVIVLVIIGILSSLAYVAYHTLLDRSRAAALASTAGSIDAEASALARLSNTTTINKVQEVLDKPGNGFDRDFPTIPKSWTESATGRITIAYDPYSLAYVLSAPESPDVCYLPADTPGGQSDIHRKVGVTC